jgi:hypothetical protein
MPMKYRLLQKHNRPLWVAMQGLIRPTPYTYIVSYIHQPVIFMCIVVVTA